MATRVLIMPRGTHTRTGLSAALDTLRGALLQVLPAPLDAPARIPANATPAQLRRREWHQVACGFGDLLEIATGYLLAVLMAVLVAVSVFVIVAGVLLLIGSWWVWVGTAAATVIGLAVWWMAADLQRVDRLTADLDHMSDVDGKDLMW